MAIQGASNAACPCRRLASRYQDRHHLRKPTTSGTSCNRSDSWRVADSSFCYLDSHSSNKPSTSPDLILLYTTDTLGVLEPCGCNPIGGLARRATLIRQLRKQYPHVLLLDSGNWAGEGERGRLVLEAMQEMGYDGIGLGLTDLLTKAAWLPLAQRLQVPLLSAFPERNQLPSFVRREALYLLGGHRVGVVALAPTPEGWSEEELHVHLAWVLRRLRRQADVVVVLSQWGLERDRALAQWQAEEGWVDLLIGNGEARRLKEPLRFGRTWLLPTSHRGEYVGLVEVRWKEGRPDFMVRQLPVDTRYEPASSLQARSEAFQRMQAERLRRASLRAGQEREEAEGFRPDFVPASCPILVLFPLEDAFARTQKAAQWGKMCYLEWYYTLTRRSISAVKS